jgi:hypothetical protein
MHEPMQFRDRSRSIRVLLAGVIPAAIGALAGILLGVSSGAYWAIGAVAAIGSILAGFEHEDGWSAADRGLAAGAVYGAALLIAHAIAGTHAKVSLGGFPPLLIVITAIAGMLLCAIGGCVGRVRREHSGVPPAEHETGD